MSKEKRLQLLKRYARVGQQLNIIDDAKNVSGAGRKGLKGKGYYGDFKKYVGKHQKEILKGVASAIIAAGVGYALHQKAYKGTNLIYDSDEFNETHYNYDDLLDR